MGLGLGWAFFLASLSSLEVECLSPPSPPLLRAAGPRSGNKKQDSITGRWNPKWPRLPPYVCSCECVCLRGSHPYLSYILYLIFFVLTVFACLLHPFPSEHTLALRPLPTTSSHTHTPKPPPPICMVCVSRAVAMPTAHFLCLSCRRIWSESTLPPTGYCRQLQALKHQFPHQSPKGFGQKKHWHRNVAVVVLPSATINIAFFFLFFLEI